MRSSLARLVPKLSRAPEEQAVCPVCRTAVAVRSGVRLRGVVVHRDCLGYQGRRLLRGDSRR